MRVKLVIYILHHLDVGLRALLLDDELSAAVRLADQTVEQLLLISKVVSTCAERSPRRVQGAARSRERPTAAAATVSQSTLTGRSDGAVGPRSDVVSALAS